MTTTEARKYHVYIAGPMESVGGNWNEPYFDAIAEKLEATGRCIVCNPAQVTRELCNSFADIQKLDKAEGAQVRKKCLKYELNWIMDHADVLLMLPGWERSPGAQAEKALADALKIPTHDADSYISTLTSAA